MADWQHKMTLTDIIKEGLELPELSDRIAERIRTAPFFDDFENDLEEVAVLFDEADDAPSYDYALNELYDWADCKQPTPPGRMQRKNCWIESMG